MTKGPRSPGVGVDATRTSAPNVTEDECQGKATGSRPVGPTQYRDPTRYDILGEHGRGGLGRVSRAHDNELGRDIAIKELISRGHLSEIRFLREALITARLEHPGIVPIYEAGRWPDGTPFYAMKLVSGRSLRELLAERTTIDERIGLLHHVIAVADAIAYAHGRNIIHRDLKPANVIVGDFGETIVIDWGIAKDLTAGEASIADGPFRSTQAEGLTSAGSVLGTPAYMAPEQRRGEHVDQRADVFAIGAMLWELCALREVPGDARQRRRRLRRAGIDKDLAAIIDKALDADPARRYADAGALAADLKRFKSGARIAAREYSLIAMLAHWTRRHRRLALSLGIALALAAGGTIVYVRNIAIERNRADRAAVEAEAQRKQAQRAADELTLQHAQLLLRSDPTAAFERLATYRGADASASALLRARARGLGVAVMKATPHAGRVVLAESLPSGELLTVGEQTVAKSSIAGGSRVIARGVTRQRVAAYAPSRGLLAYACDPGGLCLLDTTTEAARPVAAQMSSFASAGLAFSPDEHLLAAISSDGTMAVWEIPQSGVPSERYRTKADGGQYIVFANNETIVAIATASVGVYQLSPSRGAIALLHGIAVTDVGDAQVSQDGSVLAVAAGNGTLSISSMQTGAKLSSVVLCKGELVNIAFVPRDLSVAYACQDGDAGIWDTRRKASIVAAHIDGGASMTVASDDGRYVLIGGNRGDLLVYDAETGMLSTYLGHTGRITALQPPARGFPYLASGDSSGALRIWPLPRTDARVVIRSKARLWSAVFLSDEGPVLGIGATPALPWWSFDGKSGVLDGHTMVRSALALSRIEPRFAMYASDGTVELWSLAETPNLRLLNTDHASVAAVRYLADGAFVTAGREGSVVLWSPDAATHRELGRVPGAITSLYIKPKTDVMIAGTVSGRLWKLDGDRVAPLTEESEKVSRYGFSEDGRWLATASPERGLRLYDAETWSVRAQLALPASVRALEFSASGDLLAVGLQSTVQFVNVEHMLRGGTLADMPVGRMPWTTLEIRERLIRFSADGQWLGITDEAGALWFYSFEHKQLTCEIVSEGPMNSGYFSGDSRHFVATDPEGRVLLVDMAAVRRTESQ